jgi:hypothetical protein
LRGIVAVAATVAAFQPAWVRAQAKAPGQAGAAPAGDAAISATLRTIFSPRRSPAHRTMGLSQRTFLDLVEQSKPKLEVALVIDGTDSMSAALDGVRGALSQMMGDLELYKRNDVAYQLVVYRDVGSPAGEVEFPLNRQQRDFTDDRESVLAAIGQLAPQSGAPYFPELVDEGIHRALTELAWSDAQDVSRWVIVFGDAPPFDPTFHEESTGASRRFATDALVALASTRQIRINCVLCTSRDEDRQAFEAVVDQTRGFMNALSTGTGGLMLDLSYDDIRAAMLQADSVREVEYTSVGTISSGDVEKLQASLVDQLPASDAPVVLAVLPHAPLEKMTFATDSPATELATELRMRIKSVPGVTVSEPLLVERRFDRLRRNPNYSGLRGGALLQALGRSLGADYLLWGDVQDRGDSRNVTTRLYDAATGEVLAEAQRASSGSVGSEQLGSLLAGDVLSASLASAAHQPLANHLAAVRDDLAQRDSVTRQIATNSSYEDLVSGLAALEKALSYAVGDAEGISLLQEAQRRLDAAVRADSTNALPHFLLANCVYNLAKQAPEEGGGGAALMKQFGRELRAAYRFRTALPDGDLRREIEADYALLVRGRPAEAIPLYERLADGRAGSDASRRANWMLAGIYGGDWGVAPDFVDREKARERLIRILALWPDSAEAQFIKQVLRWDDEAGGTRFPHLPKENEDLAAEIDREV